MKSPYRAEIKEDHPAFTTLLQRVVLRYFHAAFQTCTYLLSLHRPTLVLSVIEL
jgi:hypothetical protein